MKRTRALDGRGAVLATAAVVATLLLGGGVVSLLHDQDTAADRPDAARLSGGSGPAAGTSDVDLDLGPVSDPADVAGCLTPEFASSPADVTVVYGVRQTTHDGSSPVLILRNQAGATRLCDVFGGDFPASAPLPEATAGEPVAYYSTGRRDWNCEQATHTLRRFTVTEWLSVADPVHTVRLRFLVADEAGPWFTTTATNGFAHLQAWLDGPVRKGVPVVLEQQVLDAAGEPVTQSVVPASQKLPGCRGGSVQIG